MDEIRAVLNPEIRVGWGRTDADMLRVMNRDQESLAKSLGDGHRLLRGVAGSGKTVTLICRARHLREVNPTCGSSCSATTVFSPSPSDYRRKVSWREIGVQAAGRSRALRTNYRNTRPILGCAYRVIRELDANAAAVREPEDEYVVPNRGAAADRVRLSTIHGSKGLDASHVLLIDGHDLERRDEEEARRLLYIAMTRARDELCVCYHGESRLMAELEVAVAEMEPTK